MWTIKTWPQFWATLYVYFWRTDDVTTPLRQRICTQEVYVIQCQKSVTKQRNILIQTFLSGRRHVPGDRLVRYWSPTITGFVEHIIHKLMIYVGDRRVGGATCSDAGFFRMCLSWRHIKSTYYYNIHTPPIWVSKTSEQPCCHRREPARCFVSVSSFNSTIRRAQVSL